MSVIVYNRNWTTDIGVTVELVVRECPSCGITYALPRSFYDKCHAKGERFYCPNGHSLGWNETDSDRLRKAEAQKAHLADQLQAATLEAERRRVQLVRDRHRFANGVCPCCNRSFENVRRHMQSKHPDYDPADLTVRKPTYECSCGGSFETPRGLAIHQGHMRRAGWDDPGAPVWRSHLTVVK